uniref:G-protein coupled receptors family 1 profile domain-containing protein n=1 Tax=Cyanoderma ruficeps TaxID=181631 RepID=A0A8C3X6B9_9PASS
TAGSCRGAVTTKSPSPAWLTQGDNLCETDVTNMAIHSVTLLICLCGLVGNGAVLCLLSLKAHTFGIFALAFADFIFLLFTVPSALLFLVEDVSCSPIMPLLYLSFVFQLSEVSYYWALLRLTSISGVTYMYRICLLCCCREPPLRLQWLVYSVQYWGFLALLTVIPAVINLCPSHQHEHCRAALISMYALILLLFVGPMVISITIDFIKAKRGSKKQQPKRHDIIIFLIVLLILILTFCNLLQDLGFIIVPSQVFFLVSCIHSSIKPFIYFLAGKCWTSCSVASLQSSLQRVFDDEKEKTARRNDAPKDTGV